MIAALTTPYHLRYPDVRLSVVSAPSASILDLIENLEADAGLTYLANEPLNPADDDPGVPGALPLADRRGRPA